MAKKVETYCANCETRTDGKTLCNDCRCDVCFRAYPLCECNYVNPMIPADVKLARQMHDEVMASATIANAPNYTGLHSPDRFMVGYIGELAVKRFFDNYRVKYKWEPRTDGTPDECDFELPSGIKIDVKTAGEGHFQNALISLDQLERLSAKGIDLFAIAKWHRPNFCEIMGACWVDKLESIGRKVYPGDGRSPRVKIASFVIHDNDLPIGPLEFKKIAINQGSKHHANVERQAGQEMLSQGGRGTAEIQS